MSELVLIGPFHAVMSPVLRLLFGAGSRSHGSVPVPLQLSATEVRRFTPASFGLQEA